MGMGFIYKPDTNKLCLFLLIRKMQLAVLMGNEQGELVYLINIHVLTSQVKKLLRCSSKNTPGDHSPKPIEIGEIYPGLRRH